MHVRNGTSRYQIAQEAYQLLAEREVISKNKASELIEKIDALLVEHRAYIKEHGADMEVVHSWQWKGQ
jgi:phosphoketolase